MWRRYRGRHCFCVFLNQRDCPFIREFVQVKAWSPFKQLGRREEKVLMSQPSEPSVAVCLGATRREAGDGDLVFLPFATDFPIYVLESTTCARFDPQKEDESVSLAQWSKFWLWGVLSCHDFIVHI